MDGMELDIKSVAFVGKFQFNIGSVLVMTIYQ